MDERAEKLLALVQGLGKEDLLRIVQNALVATEQQAHIGLEQALDRIKVGRIEPCIRNDEFVVIASFYPLPREAHELMDMQDWNDLPPAIGAYHRARYNGAHLIPQRGTGLMNSVILVEDLAQSLTLNPQDVEQVFRNCYDIMHGGQRTMFSIPEIYRGHLRSVFP